MPDYLPGSIFQFNKPETDLNLSLKDLPKVNYNSKAPAPFKSTFNEKKDPTDPYPYKDILHESKQDSAFSLLYFSRKNIEEVQRRIRNKVYELSKGEYKIGEQNETNVVLVMREVYLKYAMNEVEISRFKESISYLNDIATKEISETVIKNIKEHLNYLRDKKTVYGGVERVLPTPENTSLAGLKNYD